MQGDFNDQIKRQQRKNNFVVKRIKKEKSCRIWQRRISTRKYMLLMMRRIVKVELKKNIHQTLKSAKSCKVA